MAIYNKRFIIKLSKKSENILDDINSFFKKNLKKNDYPLRFAIVDVKGKKMVVDATILEEENLI